MATATTTTPAQALERLVLKLHAERESIRGFIRNLDTEQVKMQREELTRAGVYRAATIRRQDEQLGRY